MDANANATASQPTAELASERPGKPDDLGAQVRASVGRLYRRFRTERPDGSLGDSALDVLGRLEKAGPQTLTELSEQDRVAPGTMSQTVNRLTSAGYAVRTRDESDGRKVLISATPAGAKLGRAAREQRHGWLDARLETLTEDDKRIVLRACELFAAIADS